MILSKGNLSIVDLCKESKQIPALNNIHIQRDGTTIAASNDIIVVVSPVDEAIRRSTVLEETIVSGDHTIPSDAIKNVLRNIPSDKLFKGLLEYVDFAIIDNMCIFKGKDGKKEVNKTKVKPYTHGYIKYKEILKRVLGLNRKSTKVILNLRRLNSLLEIIIKVCPDSNGDNPVFIEFTDNNDIIVRAVNQTNGQKIFGIMTSFKSSDDKWLNSDTWEKQFMSNRIKQKIKGE